jgi:mono/diheme cytochrome c family protein
MAPARHRLQQRTAKCTAISAFAVLAAFVLAAVAAPAASASPVQFDLLRARISEDKLTSVEAVLPVLPLDLRSHYVLMFRSRSLQGASYQNPRAILYGHDARFIVTFNGDPAHNGFNALETMEFDDQAKAFVFREIVFPDASKPDAPVSFSEPNPGKCLECHGNPPRPVWDAFPVWPGAYGERYRAHLGKQESEGLDAFLQAQPGHPRYGVLHEVGKLASREAFYPSAKTRYQGVETEPPNSELNTLLSRLNFQRIANELAGKPLFPAYQYALLAAVSPGCGAVQDYLPDALSAAGTDRYAQIAHDADNARHKLGRTKARRLDEDSGRAGTRAAAIDDDAVIKLRFIVEAGLGVDTAQWSLALEKGSYDFTTAQSSTEALAPFLMNAVSRSDSGLADLSFYRSFTRNDPYCSHLRLQSRRALAGAPPELQALVPAAARQSVSLSGPPRPALVDHCAACHGTGAAPAIPFGQPERLAEMLPSGNYTHGTLIEEIHFRLSAAAGAGRMPLDLHISDAERSGLEDYLGALLRWYQSEKTSF